MKKNGFTLIELLAVIAVLAIILLIAVPNILAIVNSAKDSIYVKNEQLLKQSAINYYAVNFMATPSQIGEVNIVRYNTLISGSYISDIKDPKNASTTCDGYVLVTKTSNTDFNYTPYIKCGTNYQTTNYEVSTALTSVEVLAIAGGGSGGSHKDVGTATGAGGGGAGGLVFNASYAVTDATPINVTIGAGGIRPQAEAGTNGSNTIFGTITAIGGGGGGARNSNPNNGGSGGGVGYVATTGGTGTAGQGFAGGNGGSIFGGAGGGGAGAAGTNATVDTGAAGGVGLYYGDRFGTSYGELGWFAAGGGGGSRTASALPGSLGGNGGAGDGGASDQGGQDALTNTGSGGGGSSGGGYYGGNGASGIVLIRYLGIPKATGGFITSYNGYTIHAFLNGTSQFIPLSL